jgi:hypothetical protein
MIRLGTVLLTATMTLLLLWLLVGCTGGEGARGASSMKPVWIVVATSGREPDKWRGPSRLWRDIPR